MKTYEELSAMAEMLRVLCITDPYAQSTIQDHMTFDQAVKHAFGMDSRTEYQKLKDEFMQDIQDVIDAKKGQQFLA